VPRAGLLATQGIRGGFSRAVLERIKETGDIFMAWSDRQWVLAGAAVHVSIVGFDSGAEQERMLNGEATGTIHASLSGGIRLNEAKKLPNMKQICFQGPVKVGPFELTHDLARNMLAQPSGPTGRKNTDVLKPWHNGKSITDRYKGEWIVDFAMLELTKAAEYERPFEYVRRYVKPVRDRNARATRKKHWWLWGEPNPTMRAMLEPLSRYMATCQTAKFRIWVWFSKNIIAAQTVIGVARCDDYFFGVLHSSFHELWALRMGTQLEDRPRYTPTTCFETFPLPWPPGKEPTDHPAYKRIGDAARELNEQRERWLNPPEWIEPIAETVDMADDFADVPEEARALIRESATMAAAARNSRLKKRTLTNLYNERPTWLRLAHEKLDRAVLAAYAATDPEGGWAEDWAEVWADSGAGRSLPEGHPLAEKRTETDQKVLENLLRLNLARARQETG